MTKYNIKIVKLGEENKYGKKKLTFKYLNGKKKDEETYTNIPARYHLPIYLMDSEYEDVEITHGVYADKPYRKIYDDELDCMLSLKPTFTFKYTVENTELLPSGVKVYSNNIVYLPYSESKKTRKFLDKLRAVRVEEEELNMNQFLNYDDEEEEDDEEELDASGRTKYEEPEPYTRANEFVTKKMFYVLKLEQDKYYVGETFTLNLRLSQHYSGNGSRWTSKFKPVQLYKVYTDHDKTYDENELTLKYMRKFGWQNVRGGHYQKINIKKPKKL